ncbi:MAG: chloride channel protein [Saprospiraceae bacterium]|nr:chloride channel protein [Saprospiraceae bacterium]
MQRKKLVRRITVWRLKHISNSQFMGILGVIIGLAVGLSAVVIKNTVHLIQYILKHGFIGEYQKFIYLAYPAIGILLAVLFIRYIIRQRVGHGIPSVLYAISEDEGKIKSHNMFSSIVTSALTVGFGGSVGLEGPTVATGAAVGSNIGKSLHLTYKQITLLLGCACAGALAAIFKAPIAAIVFALEVIMLDLTMASLVPLLLASVTAVLTSYLFLGQDVLYHFELIDKFRIKDLHLYILLGILTGFVSVYFTRMYMFIGKVFDKLKSWYWKLIVGGLVLGILIFIFPALYGEGYESINSCLKGDLTYLFKHSLFFDYQNNIIVVLLILLAIVIFKVIATSVTFGSGGIGGIFAPTLFIGANTGLLFAKFFDYFKMDISLSNFALVGMAGCIAGVLHAPLTAIFLIAEITGGYQLFLPLMITATISYATIRIFETNSVYTIQLAKRGQLITHHKDKAMLKRMKIDELIETNFLTISYDANLRDLVKIVSESQRNIFPVIDEDNTFQGLIIMDDIRKIMFKPELYDITPVSRLMIIPDITIDPDESMEEIAHKFHKSSNFNMPVLKDGKYLGFVSRANIFSAYRELLKEFSED